jgi:hypothetical protein
MTGPDGLSMRAVKVGGYHLAPWAAAMRDGAYHDRVLGIRCNPDDFDTGFIAALLALRVPRAFVSPSGDLVPELMPTGIPREKASSRGDPAGDPMEGSFPPWGPAGGPGRGSGSDDEPGQSGCLLSGPGRGDCDHFVGLPPVLDATTTDVYGRPYGWCWLCWTRRQLDASRADLARATAELELRGRP